jgi:hypothetical protein
MGVGFDDHQKNQFGYNQESEVVAQQYDRCKESALAGIEE